MAKKGTICLSLELSLEANRMIEEIAGRNGVTKSETLRKAIALYVAADEARRGGLHVGASKARNDLDVVFVSL